MFERFHTLVLVIKVFTYSLDPANQYLFKSLFKANMFPYLNNPYIDIV